MSVTRIHATNIIGTGAVQLFSSLFPELIRTGKVCQADVSPAVAKVAHEVCNRNLVVRDFRRILPKAISRVLECTVFARQFEGSGALLVLGDIPLYGIRRQVLLVHSPYMLGGQSKYRLSELKYLVSRALFALNARYVTAFIVQSEFMKSSLESCYSELRGRVHVIPQPPPEWLIESEIRRSHAVPSGGLALFYPASGYPHKNHELLRRVQIDPALLTVLEQIIVTVKPEEYPNLSSDLVRCVGPLNETEMLQHYRDVDAILFLSKKETYGFPLLEGMWIGLPIICPDLPYARSMCGKEAIYFNPDSPHSLKSAVLELHTRLSGGWWPDWSSRLRTFPKSWAECARDFLKLC